MLGAHAAGNVFDRAVAAYIANPQVAAPPRDLAVPADIAKRQVAGDAADRGVPADIADGGALRRDQEQIAMHLGDLGRADLARLDVAARAQRRPAATAQQQIAL